MAKITRKPLSRASKLTVQAVMEPVQQSAQLLSGQVTSDNMQEPSGTFRINYHWPVLPGITDENQRFLAKRNSEETDSGSYKYGPQEAQVEPEDGREFLTAFTLAPFQEDMDPLFWSDRNLRTGREKEIILDEMQFSFDQRDESGAIVNHRILTSAGEIVEVPLRIDYDMVDPYAKSAYDLEIGLFSKEQSFTSALGGAYDGQLLDMNVASEAFMNETLRQNPFILTNIGKKVNPFKTYVLSIKAPRIGDFIHKYSRNEGGIRAEHTEAVGGEFFRFVARRTGIEGNGIVVNIIGDGNLAVGGIRHWVNDNELTLWLRGPVTFSALSQYILDNDDINSFVLFEFSDGTLDFNPGIGVKASRTFTFGTPPNDHSIVVTARSAGVQGNQIGVRFRQLPSWSTERVEITHFGNSIAVGFNTGALAPTSLEIVNSDQWPDFVTVSGGDSITMLPDDATSFSQSLIDGADPDVNTFTLAGGVDPTLLVTEQQAALTFLSFNVSMKFRSRIVRRDAPPAITQNIPAHSGGKEPDSILFVDPTIGATIRADGNSGIQTNLAHVDEALVRRLQGGYTERSEISPNSHMLDDACYEIITVPLFPRGKSICADERSLRTAPHISPSSDGKIMCRQLVRIMQPLTLHHVFALESHLFECGTRVSQRLLDRQLATQDVTVALVSGPRSDRQDEALLAHLHIDDGVGKIVDRIIGPTVENNTIGTDGNVRPSLRLWSVPLVTLVFGGIPANGNGYQSQGTPIFIGQSGRKTADRSDMGIQGGGSTKGVRGCEQYIEVRWTISDDDFSQHDVGGNEFRTGLVGIGGHTVYLVCKKHLAACDEAY